jgi:flagellar biosynthetic protein FliR
MDLSGQLAAAWGMAPALLLVSCRVGALFFTAPLIGGPFVPARIKVMLSMVIAVMLLPIVAPHLPKPLDLGLGFFLLIMLELATGATIGFACTCIYEGVRAGGELINRYAGFTAAENFDPESGMGEGPVGDLLLIGMVLVFLAADGHLHLLATAAASFGAVPIGAFEPGARTLHFAAEATGQCMAVAAMISFPVLAVIMLITVGEGVVAKAVPQINILFISFSVKILVSLLVLYAGMPATVAFMGACTAAIQRITGAAVGAM